MAELLADIQGSEDVQALEFDQLKDLAEEIRAKILAATSKNGGHVGPNLGVVELTIALHRHFSTPTDRFVFDVSHQGYVHKLLTGRQGDAFDKIRKSGGLSGFLNREESPHDCYGAGHAGTALSAALGMARARDLQGGDEHIVAVLGDAAFTCGITIEALNNIRNTTDRLIVILNDNKWSIAPNVGAISRYLNDILTKPIYNRLHDDLEGFLKKIPGGSQLSKIGEKIKIEAKDFLTNQESSLFEKYGLRYIGPIDGHDLKTLNQYIEFCKHSKDPLILHVLTTKGKGFPAAIDNPEKFHGTGTFCPATGLATPAKASSPPSYQNVFGEALVRHAVKNPKIVGITAAMPSGTGLTHLRDALPKQYFDVGIAEEHAVLFAAGLASSGIQPVCAIYSTFLQRAYDPIIHDVCLQNLNVVFCMDRAGLSPNDGATHHGLFDIAYLRCVPNLILMQPKDEDELLDMLHTSLEFNGPIFIRYPRGAGLGVALKDNPEKLPIGKAEILSGGKEVWIWALGSMVQEALRLAEAITQKTKLKAGVVNARFAKPLDGELLEAQARDAQIFITLEDHVISGGFGAAVLEELSNRGLATPVQRFGWPDAFVEHGDGVADLRAKNGLSQQSIEAETLKRLESI